MKDRIRLPDGSLARWFSPRGTPPHIAAAFPRWGWNDLTTALVPNGRPATSRSPLGIPKRSWIDLLYAGGAAAGFLSPPGVDPQAGRRFKLELLARDAPYAQAPKRAFSVRVQRLRLVLPTAERGTRGSSG